VSIFEYVMILISVVLSLGLTQVLTGAAELVRAHGLVRWSLTYCLWLVAALAFVLDMWASMWLLHDTPRWPILSLLFSLLSASTVYLLTVLLIPSRIGDGPIDLWQFHLDNRRLTLLAALGYCVAGFVMNLLVLPPAEMGNVANFTFIVPIALALGLAWWTPNRWVQRIAPVFVVGMMVLYFAAFFESIG
jgi:hypothetical protein